MATEKSINKEQVVGFGKRFLAFLIDLLVLVTMRKFLRFSFHEPLRAAINLVFSLGYAPLMIYYYQATLGKMALGLKIISVDNKKLEFFQVLLREWIGKFISAFIFLLGFLWVIWDEKKQAWHDKIANTLVVKT